jgi:drug/metabolite transporter (DMT)-like permease
VNSSPSPNAGDPPARNLLQIHTAVLLFGFAALFGSKQFLPLLAPAVIVFGRVVFASLVLLLASVLRRDIVRLPTWHGMLAFTLSGALLAVHWTTFFQSVRDSGVAIALITYSTFPVFVAFFEPLFFREKLRGTDVALAAATLTGIVILTPTFEPGDRTTRGILWGIVSGLTFALLSLLNRQFVRRHSSMTIAFYQDAFAAVALLPFVVGQWPPFTTREVLLLAILGVFCTALAHSLFIAGMRRVSARTASMIASLEPVYGAVLAGLVLHENPSARTLLGGAIVLGVAFYATLRA